jgi:deoxyribonuclease-4
MRLGAHVSHSGGIHTAVDRAQALGAESLQIFSQSPRTWRPTRHDPANFERFRERSAEADIVAVCHATYLINLGATDDGIYGKSVEALARTMEIASAIGAEGVVFHVGSHLGRGLDAAMEQIVPALEAALGRAGGDTWLLLENSAGAGGTIGVRIPELVRIVDELGRPDRVGICLDTCHLWASGVDVGEPAEVDALLAEVDELLGLDRLRCLHVNDSQLPLGCNRDRHENVGRGEIGKGLATMLGHPRLQGLPAVMETPGETGRGVDEREMESIRALHKTGVRRWKRRRSRA